MQGDTRLGPPRVIRAGRTASFDGMLEVSGISKRFGATVALDDVSLTVREGEILGFLGPNGSGKTTTMRSIMGLIAVDAGRVTWRARPVDTEVRHRFGYMPAERGMYPKMHVREQLVYFARLAGRSAAEAGAAADGWLDRLGLGDRANDEVQALSSGNQQRVQLAIALVHDPDLLILDEPFSGLDPIAVETMKAMLLEQVGRGAAVLFSSHQLDLVSDICRDVVIVDRGRVVLDGDVAAIRERSPVRDVTVKFAAPRPSSPNGSCPDGWEVVDDGSDGSVRLRVPASTDLDEVLIVPVTDRPDRRPVVRAARAVGSVPPLGRPCGGIAVSTSPVALASAREVRTRLRRPSFFVFTGLLVVAILASGILARVLNDDSRPSYDVGTVGTIPELFGPALDVSSGQADITVVVRSFDDPAAAAQALEDGTIDALVDGDDESVTWNHSESDTLAPVLDQSWRTAQAADAATSAGLDDAQVVAILDPPPLQSDVLDPDDEPGVGLLVGFASAVLLFISITNFGSYVLNGVVEEKSTGVVEVLLSHVRAHQLLAGKVLGVGAVALLQFSAAVLAGLVSLRISGITVPSELWVGLPSTIGWFIGGFLLYSTLFALAGSFVSRVEDAQGAAAPITMAFTMGYILVFAFGSDPSGTPARILSILPPFAPLLMPLRMVTGAASIVEIVIAAVLLALAVWGMIRLAGSVYSRTLLHRGSRLTWRQAFHRQTTTTT